MEALFEKVGPRRCGYNASHAASPCLSVLTHSMWHAPENQFGKLEIQFGWAGVQFSTATPLGRRFIFNLASLETDGCHGEDAGAWPGAGNTDDKAATYSPPPAARCVVAPPAALHQISCVHAGLQRCRVPPTIWLAQLSGSRSAFATRENATR